jgi:hypothetical protein
MTWEAVLDRIGGLWNGGILALVGFWVANQFELRRDALQAKRDRDREWREGQRSDIAELQRALQRFFDSTGHVAMMFTQMLAFSPGTVEASFLQEPWYQEWTSSSQSVFVLTTNVESEALIELIQKLLGQASVMIGSARDPIDPDNSRAATEKFSSRNSQLLLLTREAQALAGQIYRDLGRPPVDSDNRSWLRKRLC